MAAKGFAISVNGKHNIGDIDNDFVAAKFIENGRNAEVYFEGTFPDGSVLAIPEVVINVTNIGSGDPTDVGPLDLRFTPTASPATPLPPLWAKEE